MLVSGRKSRVNRCSLDDIARAICIEPIVTTVSVTRVQRHKLFITNYLWHRRRA
jgi:hypothetical protein